MKTIVKIQYLFSRRPLAGSKLISWGTNHQYPDLSFEEVPSHVAVLINGKWVIESTLATGVRVIGYNKWKEINIEVAKIDCVRKDWSFSVIKGMFKEIKGRKYDWGGIIYLAFRLAKQKYLGKPLPSVNKFNDPNKYFCTEVLSKMTGLTYEMSTPVDVMMKVQCLSEAQNTPSKLAQSKA